jgi:IclR family pca regulon transcriptional regulator
VGGDDADRDQTRSFPTLREARYSHSLERGLAILACFTPERPLLGIAELAEGLGMSRPTTHRYVSTLVALGYLEQDASRKYRLGLGVTDLGMAALNATGLRKHAHPYLEELRKRSGHTVEMAVLDGPEILLVDQARGSRERQSKLDANVPGGSRLPAYCTSMGKVLLAYLPADRRSSLISEMELARRAPKTITSKEALREELESVREEGFAVNDEELEAGSRAIAAPVREESGDVVAAVNVVAHGGVIELEELVDRFWGPLVTTADRISGRLGWREVGK